MGRVWIIIIVYTSLMIGAAMVPVFWADEDPKKEEPKKEIVESKKEAFEKVNEKIKNEIKEIANTTTESVEKVVNVIEPAIKKEIVKEEEIIQKEETIEETEEEKEVSYVKDENESDLHIVSYSLKGSNKNVLVVEMKFNMNYELNKIKCNLFNNGSIVKSLNSIDEISASKGDITDISFGFVREKFDHIECEPFKKVEFKVEPERKANIKEVVRNTPQVTQPQQNNKKVIQPKKVESDDFALPEL